MKNPSNAQMRLELAPSSIASQQSSGASNSQALTLARVTRVDPVTQVVDLVTVTGKIIPYTDVSISFPSAGHRHFLGGLPEESDICIIGFHAEESGYTERPFILAWVIPGVQKGYDWLPTQFVPQDELAMDPVTQESLIGVAQRRRHKSLLLEKGNIAASSSQGSDILLDESVSISNRRGNEIILRDQDQSIVFRSLQQMHAGAGFRVYSGLVQRDAASSSTQMFSDSIDWSGSRQVDSQSNPLLSSQLLSSSVKSNLMLDQDSVFFITKQDLAKRLLFIDSTSGLIYDRLVSPQNVYGGKSINHVYLDDVNMLSEYRIEVSHSNNGSLPVTEQTDGFDIDRLPLSSPASSSDLGSLSSNRPLVEFVLGSVVGNDPINDRSSYSLPLAPRLYDSGSLSPSLVPSSSIADQAAFLLRVHNPVNPSAPSAFISINKSGKMFSYMPGGHDEIYDSGSKSISLSKDDAGLSYSLSSSGLISLVNSSVGRPQDNLGVLIESQSGAVSINAGGSLSNSSNALTLSSAQSALIKASNSLLLNAPSVSINNSNSISLISNSSVSINSGNSLSLSTQSLSQTVSGRMDLTLGGPLNAMPTNGPSRSTVFAASPVTGSIGSTVDDYTVLFGGKKELFVVGRSDTEVLLGSISLTAGSLVPSSPSISPGDGVNLTAGPPGLSQSLSLSSPLTGGGVILQADLGSVSLRATKGQVNVQAVAGVSISSAALVQIIAPSMLVSVPTPSPGAVMSDGCIDSLTGRPFVSSGTLGVQSFRAGV